MFVSDAWVHVVILVLSGLRCKSFKLLFPDCDIIA